jgi:hypothetical protein
VTDFENSLIAALHAAAQAQTELARQIQHQTLAINNLIDIIAEADGEDDDFDVYVADVMNPRNG